MKHHTVAALGIAGLVLSGSALASPGDTEATRILDLELRFLEKASSRTHLPDSLRQRIEETLVRFDARRRQAFAKLGTSLKALESAWNTAAGDAARLGPLLEDVEEKGEALRALRQEKRAELESMFTNQQKLEIVARFARKHKERPKLKRLMKWAVENVAPSLLTNLVGLSSASTDALLEVFRQRKPVREALHEEWKGLRTEILAAAEDPGLDEERARLLIARGKVFGQKVERSMEEGKQAAKAALPIPERARLVVKVYQGARFAMGFVENFKAFEEFEYFR